MNEILMVKGAKRVVETCVGVRPGEQVLIVTEGEKLPIAQAVAQAVYAVDAEPMIALMLPRERDGQEPPAAIAAAITHTHAVKEACKRGSRGGVLTQFTQELMIHGGLEADFREVAPTCKAVAGILAGAKEVRLTTPHGTDLTFSAEGRRSNAMYCMVEPGEFSPVPTVEANVSPLEGTAQGIIVANASIPYIGIQAEMLKRDLEQKQDPNVYNIAELGVGLNPKCRFMGFMLEDEGVRGSVHIGIGTSITLGGNVKAACHYDLIMTEPTLIVDGQMVLHNGSVVR